MRYATDKIVDLPFPRVQLMLLSDFPEAQNAKSLRRKGRLAHESSGYLGAIFVFLVSW